MKWRVLYAVDGASSGARVQNVGTLPMNVRELREQPHLAHLNDAVLEEYAEDAEDEVLV